MLNEITRYCQKNEVHSGIVIGIIGSVENAQINFLKALPGKYEGVNYTGPLEIVCAQGPIAMKDNTPIIHIHIQLSEREISSGGHLA